MAALNMPTLADVVWPGSAVAGRTGERTRRLARTLVLAFVGSLLMTISAKVQISFWPVPMTMQTLVVLVLAMAYGWRLALSTMMLYLAEGAVGLPVFSGTPERGLGLTYMAGPTGGYLVGFVLGAGLCGWLAEKGWDRSMVRVAIAMLCGHAMILGCGVAWLAMLMGWEKAIQYGLTPFWAATMFKTAMGVAALPLAWRALGKR